MESILNTIINNATTSFMTATGFSLQSLIDWVGEIIVQILGMGLGLVKQLLPWILAIIVITVVVRLIYHALKWLHILR